MTQDFAEPDNLTKHILEELFSVDFPGVRELKQQLDGLKVRKIDDDGCLEFKVMDDVKIAEVLERVPVEASYSDIGRSDTHGVRVHILLHVRNGKMDELEYYKDDNTEILRKPIIDELIIETNGTPWSWTTEQ